MNLSSTTDQRRGKFEVKAKENELNILQSAEVGNHEVSVSACLTLTLKLENYMV